ncbi:hypothetical protein HOE425_340340 [Hoeflea sp. EC-HK425]|nr:hypothetical protein HOE425_340340 [Hoeflea sp. EC-HK425]
MSFFDFFQTAPSFPARFGALHIYKVVPIPDFALQPPDFALEDLCRIKLAVHLPSLLPNRDSNRAQI